MYYKNKIEIYNSLEFYNCYDEEGFIKLSKKLKHDYSDVNLDGMFGCALCDGFNMFVFINLNIIKEENKLFDTIAHESYHLANHIMSLMGLEYKDDSHNEHIAYLIGFIANKTAKNMYKFRSSNEKNS